MQFRKLFFSCDYFFEYKKSKFQMGFFCAGVARTEDAHGEMLWREMRRHWRCRTAVLSLLLVRAAVAETGSASECLHGRDPRALSAAGVAAFLRCFAQRAGANLAAPVLASGLLGEELSALSAGEMQDALQLSPAHAELLHNVLDGHGGSPPQSAAEQARGRFQNFYGCGVPAVCLQQDCVRVRAGRGEPGV